MDDALLKLRVALGLVPAPSVASAPHGDTTTDAALTRLRGALGLIPAPSTADGPAGSSGPTVTPSAQNQVPGYMTPGQTGTGGSVPAAPMPASPWAPHPRYNLRSRASNGGNNSVASSPARGAGN